MRFRLARTDCDLKSLATDIHRMVARKWRGELQNARSKRCLLPLIWVLFSGILNAATYYVAQTGNDSNSGTIDRPLRHLSKGASLAMAGDSVIVRDGLYDNEGAVAPAYVVTLRHSGTPLQPITFMAEHRNGAILDAMNTITDDRCNGAAAYINVANAAYIIIQGFVITRGCDEGIHNNDRAHHITVRGNEIHHIANRPITDTYGRVAMGCPVAGHDIAIDHNVIHDIGRNNRGFTASLDHGLYMMCRNLTITNNTFYGQVAGWDIQLADGADNVLIANNTFASRNPRQSGQIMVWGSHVKLTIRNNIFYKAPNYAITHYTATVTDCQIYSNMVSGTAKIYDGSGCIIGPNRLGTDPMFVNAENRDYRLRPGSPATPEGIGIGGQPTGFHTHAADGSFRLSWR
jgi:hypothetical protein